MTKKQQQQLQDKDLIVVLPGDNVTQYILTKDNNNNDNDNNHNNRTKPKLGVGLRYDESTQQIYASLAGRFMMTTTMHQQQVFFIRHNYKHRYRPVVEDRIVGIVQERYGPTDGVTGGDWYRIDIGASHPALLNNVTGFEGATKRNRPILQPGQVLYLRVVSTMTTTAAAASSSASSETIVSCQLGPHDVGVTRKDWMTNEGAYGELRGGTVMRVSTGLARELLHPDNVVLYELQKQKVLHFEVAIGVNGIIWIHSTLPQYTILIQNAILNSQVLTEEQVRSMVKSLVYTVEKQLQQDRDAI